MRKLALTLTVALFGSLLGNQVQAQATAKSIPETAVAAGNFKTLVAAVKAAGLLDTLAGPSAVVAGIIATASQVGSMDPWMTWSVAVIGGGGAAGVVQSLTTVTRQISSLATAGFGNPLVSTLEAGASLFMTLMAIVVPFVAVFLLLTGLAYGTKKLLFRKKEGEIAAA